MQRLVFGFFALAASSTIYSLTPKHQTAASYLPSKIAEANTPQKERAPQPPPKTGGPKAPTPTPVPPPPPPTPVNPLKKQLKKGQIFYRLDDRTGALSCDKWTLTPTKEDPAKGTLVFQQKKSDRTVVFTYDYQITLDGAEWEFQINGIKGGKLEKIKGGVNYSQDMQCQETYELGEVRKTDFDLGSGVWYLNKAACDKAKKAAATKSPGSC